MTQGHCGRCGEHYEACSCERGPRDINVAQVGVLERMSSELRRAQEMLSLAELRVREDQARIARLEAAAEVARDLLAAFERFMPGSEENFALRDHARIVLEALAALDAKENENEL